MMSKSLFLVLLIVTKINFIFSSLNENKISPDCVADLNSGQPKKKVTLATFTNVQLVTGVRSDEEISGSDQELKVTVINEVKGSLPKQEEISQPPVQNENLSTEEVTRKRSKKETSKLRKQAEKNPWWKDMSELERRFAALDPDAYYTLPFTRDHYLPAYQAALESNLQKLAFLDERNVPFETYDLKTGEMPLHAACRRGNVEVFKFICSRIKDPKNFAAPNRAGSTPFSIAVSSRSREIVSIMKKRCSLCKCDLPDNYGRIPIMYAGLQGSKSMFKTIKKIGQNHLHRDKSGRTLLSLILPSNPVFETLVELISEDMKKDKGNTIRAIAEDISVIYENETLGGKEQVDTLLSIFGTSLEEVILTPQEHKFNPINDVLRSKDYVYYRRLRHLPESGFDINSSNHYDKLSFFESCLQNGSLDMIKYLLSDDEWVFNPSSINVIFAVDRIDVLEFLLENYPDLFSQNRPVELIAMAGMFKADKCFKFLLKRFWQDEGGIELFCEVATQITGSYRADPTVHLFDKYAVGLSKCDSLYLDEIYSDLIDYDSLTDDDYKSNYENRKKIRKALKFILHLFKERGCLFGLFQNI